MGFLKDLIGPMDPWAHGPSPWGPKAAGAWVPGRDRTYQILKETYQILKELHPILKETYQILKENDQIPSPFGIRASWGHIRPYGALARSAAAPGEVIFAKIVDSVDYPVNLRIETGKMISVTYVRHPKPSRRPN